MMLYISIALKALFVELAGVAVMTGVLYVYWNAMTKPKN